ncbi:lysophospholipase [Bernardetia litoralis DSM 6794]|uniref:Lysophospholipase n=1 Tax=Bernardetia litoralis (strain ATCC 23117 / DSM 6794 / NBRC 15988 / NCIMB 1366 / Fx l1 / Sio-4) TaxID=880071 RepID=I4AGP4_BERLS|nr:alpha/beta hydrolase [Bernardetia litoralis]AFM03129.1 lysophospholipase [Bernardetia litoralis DSM 6794]
MNLEKDFTSQTLKLEDDYEGNVIATLISCNANTGNQKSVIYIHGYIDYFFHPHVAEKFIENGFDFYALDLRKYGRSWLSHQRENYCKSITEYFEEITIVINQIYEKNQSPIYLLGHSTGGLTASSYANFGEAKDKISGLILNSPFLDFYDSAFKKNAILATCNMLCLFYDYAYIINTLSPVYIQSIHQDFEGEWNFNLKWKYTQGFPTYFKWVLAIDEAHERLRKYSNIQVPILVMHSSASTKLSKFSEEAMQNDIVLDVEDIKERGAKLGNQVTLLEIENAMHDIFLSKESVREKALEGMFEWLLEN